MVYTMAYLLSSIMSIWQGYLPVMSSQRRESSVDVDDDEYCKLSCSLYQPSSTNLRVKYEKEMVDQKLIAVIGRQFDGPIEVATRLQDILADASKAKFLPFMLKGPILEGGIFNVEELSKFDLICLCYNASDLRLPSLTGQNGVYTSLLQQIETSVGCKQVAFLITRYTTVKYVPYPFQNRHKPRGGGRTSRNPKIRDPPVISGYLRSSLYLKRPLKDYIYHCQILSWRDHGPGRHHVERLMELASYVKIV